MPDGMKLAIPKIQSLLEVPARLILCSSTGVTGGRRDRSLACRCWACQ
jgi:hypothetical protein